MLSKRLQPILALQYGVRNEIDLEKSRERAPDPDDLFPLSVSYDMQWLKRGRATCESARSTGKDPAYHDCRQNLKDSSKSMEPEVGVRLFNDAPNYGLKYSVFIDDDDSSIIIAKIHEEVGYNVEKWSDSSHVTRTLVSHLHKI